MWATYVSLCASSKHLTVRPDDDGSCDGQVEAEVVVEGAVAEEASAAETAVAADADADETAVAAAGADEG